ncbi:MAG: type IX secretion system outer membrane channel protein PorV, partial [Prevotellaceae bacterium]|nr:type IX secretion system outer membrane channel protein PorV [Prevotellaceae bacterium]
MKKLTFLLVLFACALTLSQAQNSPIVPDDYNPILTGVPSLGVNPDAAGGGMGDIGVSTKPDLNSQYWNSSKYAMAESQGGFAISYTPWLRKIVSDIDIAYLAGYYQIGDAAGTLSASLRYFSLGTVTLRNTADQIAGEDVKPYEMSFDLGYSRKLAENFSMGVNLRFIASDLSIKSEDYNAGYGFSADINGFYSLPIEISSGESKFNLGFNFSNIGTKISYDHNNTSNFLPTNFRIGASYYVPFDKYNRLAINLDANKLLVPTRKSKYAVDENGNELTGTALDQWYSKIGIIKGMGMSFSDAPGG